MGQGVSLLRLIFYMEVIPLHGYIKSHVIAMGPAPCLTLSNEYVEEWLLFLSFSVLYTIWYLFGSPI